jgi:hypothetical protein
MNLPLPYDAEFAFWQACAGSFGAWVPVQPVYEHADIWDRLVDPIFERPMYFDRQGTPITMRQWALLRQRGLDPDGHFGPNSYVRIGEDKIDATTTVSTVWLGMDHGFNYGMVEHYRPVIFETMIFGGEYDDYMRRYCSEEEARAGHDEAVGDLLVCLEPWWRRGLDRDE